jgi:PAS domain S-box-containing protein
MAGQSVQNVRHAVQTTDGRRVFLSISGSPLFDKSGKVDAAVCSLEDVTDRIKTEEMLRQNHQKTQRLFDSNVVGITLADPERVIEANDEFLRITGYKDEDLREGRMRSREMTPTEFHEVDDRCQDEMETRIDGRCLPYEKELIRKDGRRVPVVVGRARLTRKPLTFISFILDLTDQKKAEEKIFKLNEDLKRRTGELEAANKGLEAFTYSVSHDLRNPLIGIQKLSALLSERYSELLDTKGRRFLSIIQSEARDMLQLIADLLELSRFEHQEIKGTFIDMAKLARDVSEELRSTLPDRKLHVRIGPLPAAQGDTIMIRQVMRNLLCNAIKFTSSKKTAVIDVAGRTEGDQIVYSVKDNGVGFDMRYADRLFTIFQRLHGKDQFEGTGVGLAIVQQIIARHGGRVWAEGRIDEGATFYFTLPMGLPERKEDPRPMAGSQAPVSA